MLPGILDWPGRRHMLILDQMIKKKKKVIP